MIKHRLSGFGNLRSRILRAPAALRTTLKKPVRDEARLFVVAAVKITPPASAGVTGKKAQLQGEGAVERDLRSLYSSAPAAYQIIAKKDPAMAAAFYKAMLQGNFPEAQRILAASGTRWRNVPVGTFDPGLHRAERDRRGRVRHRLVPGRIVTDFRKLDRHIKKKKKNVGLLAAGFNSAAIVLSASLPAWVKRHGVLAKGIQILDTGIGFSIVIQNTAPWARAQEMQQRMNYVHRYRKEALQRKLAVMLRLEAKRLLG